MKLSANLMYSAFALGRSEEREEGKSSNSHNCNNYNNFTLNQP